MSEKENRERRGELRNYQFRLVHLLTVQEPTCVNVLMADGSVRSLPNGRDSETLRSLLLVDDGVPANDDNW